MDSLASNALNAVIIASSFVLLAIRQVQGPINISLENQKQNFARLEEKLRRLPGGERMLEEVCYADFSKAMDRMETYSSEDKNRSAIISGSLLAIISFALLSHLGILFSFPFVIWGTRFLLFVSFVTLVFSIFTVARIIRRSMDIENDNKKVEALFDVAEKAVKELA